MSSIEKRLLEEVARYNEINGYSKRLMGEQEELPPPAPADDMGMGELPPPPPEEGEEMATPPAEDTDTPESDDVEEIDITDLVNMTKSIKKELDDSKGGNSAVDQKMNDIFGKLDDLESKLGNMDMLLNKIDMLGSKVEQMKEPTAQEKLEMRSLDSYPFSQTPSKFFDQKMGEMEQTGKNEYVLTKSDIESYSPETIKDTFNPDIEEEDEFRL